MSAKALFRGLLLGVLLTSCSGQRRPIETEVPASWHSPLVPEMKQEFSSCFSWLEALDDSTLTCLVERAAEQNLDMAMSKDPCDTWLSISMEVAHHYIQLRGGQQRLQLLQKNIDAQKDNLHLVSSLLDIGKANAIDFQQAHEQLFLLEAEQPQLQVGIDKEIHHLSLLLGYLPHELFETLSCAAQLPTLPCEKPVGMPVELLERRSDIRQAKKAAASGICEAIYAYRKTVLSAFEEAENALAAFYYEQKRNGFLLENKEASAATYALVLDLYQKGLKDYLQVHLAGRSLLTAEDAYLQSNIEILLRYLDIYKALGIPPSRPTLFSCPCACPCPCPKSTLDKP